MERIDESMHMASSAPVTLVVFGASGDLARRKVIPALFNLYRKGHLPADFRILGFSGTNWRDGDYRGQMRAAVDKYAGFDFQENEWEDFSQKLYYQPGDLTAPATFGTLAGRLGELESGSEGRLYYLATPPRFFAGAVSQLARAGLLAEEGGWRRVVIEKPFGTDQASARDLNQSLHRHLDESQIYRIDHYLGKETVQNIMTFRFANTIFEPVWNCHYVDNVQITVAEDVGLEGRAGYYEGVGVVRDMFQNHLLQLLSLVAMEPPASVDGDGLRAEKVKVLRAIRPIPAERAAEYTLLGQYRGYREESGVAPDSHTPTYAAMCLFIDNWRWQGVPFYLRSGKRLAEKCTEIILEFKNPPNPFFKIPAGETIRPNLLALCLQPDEGIHLRFEAKVPETPASVRSVDMEFHYRDSFGSGALPEAYERLLMDALNGDPTLFTRADRSELAWELLDPVLGYWESPQRPRLLLYDPGTWGPAEADELLGSERTWLRGCGGHEN